MPVPPQTPQNLAFLLLQVFWGRIKYFVSSCASALHCIKRKAIIFELLLLGNFLPALKLQAQRDAGIRVVGVTLTPRKKTALSQALPLSTLLLAGYLESAPCNLRCIVINHLLFSFAYWFLSALPLLITQFAYIHKNILFWYHLSKAPYIHHVLMSEINKVSWEICCKKYIG